jgi:hypothetical protein
MLRGGNLEVHLDALDAPPLASVAVPAPLIPDLDNAVSPVDVSSVEGVHDIYFSSGVAEGDTEGAAFALLTIEFLR